MKRDRPNVLLLTVDTWRADRLSLYGYRRPTTPALERFAENAIVCENAFTLAPFTQAACIQLFTSSRPLSYGGYDRGALGRPDTLFKRFREAGYSTAGLSTTHWVSPYYGYTAGLEDDTGVFLLNTLVGTAVNDMRDTLRLFREGKISEAEMLASAGPVIRKLFDDVEDYCARMTARKGADRADFPDSKVVNDAYDYRKVMGVAARHRGAFAADPVGYVRRHLSETPDAHEWVAADWHFSRTARKLITEGAFRLSNRVLGWFNPRLARLRANRFRRSVDAHAIANKVVKQLHDRAPDRPFFIWAHFKDTHQPYVSGPGKKWYQHTPGYLHALGYSRDLDPALVFRPGNPRTDAEWAVVSALYDAALRSTDEAFGRIFAAVDSLGLAERTVIGICGDHGEEIGEHGDYGHLSMHYEHNAHVPMLFSTGRHGGMRVGGLVTLLDWAPTLAELTGVTPAPGWEGDRVDSPAVSGRDHVVMETFCPGKCAFERRPIYMGVRTRTHKYIWKEYQDPTHTVGSAIPELYDLEADHGERSNLYRQGHPLVQQFNAKIAERLLEMPEITPERVARSFGPEILEGPRRTGRGEAAKPAPSAADGG